IREPFRDREFPEISKAWISPRGDIIEVSDHFDELIESFARITNSSFEEVVEKALRKSADNLDAADWRKVENAILNQGWVAFNEGTNIGIFGGGINPEQWKAIASELVDIKK